MNRKFTVKKIKMALKQIKRYTTSIITVMKYKLKP